MTDWRKISLEAAIKARRLQAKLDLDVQKPIDVFNAVEALGLVLAFFPLDQVSGAYLNERGSHPGVLVNSQHPLSRQRYTAAHELGHHVWGHGSLVDEGGPLHRTTGAGSLKERQAETFATWFLMPKPLVEAQLRAIGIEKPTRAEELYELAGRLGASYEATAWQLVNLRRLNATDAKSLLETQPRQVKLRLAKGLPPDSLRNDVWPLDSGSNGRELTVRVGDRIIVRLPERPALGEHWQPTNLGEVLRLEDSVLEAPAHNDSGDRTTRPVGRSHERTLVLTATDGPRTREGVVELTRGNSNDRPFKLALRVEVPRRGIAERQLVRS